MANRVVRLDPNNFTQDTSGDKVVLKVSGYVGKQSVRVEIALDAWMLKAVLARLREGAKTHADKWNQAQREIGTE